MDETAIWVWLVPSFLALFLYGVAQGLVKKFAADVPAARFCLFFIVARSIVFLGWFLAHETPPPFAEEGRQFMLMGIAAYALDGLGWILYYRSIFLGPISIVGTLSAAYPAPTILFARLFLGEELTALQYGGVGAILIGCLGLSYEKQAQAEGAPPPSRAWVPLAAGALLLWGASQTLIKHSYTLPGANESNLLLFGTFGGALTLGVYGLLYGRRGAAAPSGAPRPSAWREWALAFGPMAVMAGGDLGVTIAYASGPASIVAPLTGAYPVVTVPFAAILLRERVTPLQIGWIGAVVIGMIVCNI